MNDHLPTDLIVELRKLNNGIKLANLFVVIAAVLSVTLIVGSSYLDRINSAKIEKNENWRDVEWALEKLDFQRASSIAQRLVDRFPEDYYGHWQLGSVAARTGDMKKAEQHYARAVDLFPYKKAVEELEAIRQRMQNDQQSTAK